MDFLKRTLSAIGSFFAYKTSANKQRRDAEKEPNE